MNVSYMFIVVLMGLMVGATPTAKPTPTPVTVIKNEATVVRYDVSTTENGHKFLYELSDGQFREEETIIYNKGTDEEEIAVIGSYSFWGTDGQLYVTKYTADRNGYAATTSHTRSDHFADAVEPEVIVPIVEATTEKRRVTFNG